MFIYGITLKLEESASEKFENWMKSEHIPDVMDTNLFSEVRFTRLLEPNDPEGITYNVQYGVKTKEDYEAYLETHAPLLRIKIEQEFGGKYLAFRTFLDVLYSETSH